MSSNGAFSRQARRFFNDPKNLGPRMSCTWPVFRLEGRPSTLFIRASPLPRSIQLDVACSPLVSVAGLEASVGGESLVGAASGGAAMSARTPVLLLAPSRAGPFGLATVCRQFAVGTEWTGSLHWWCRGLLQPGWRCGTLIDIGMLQLQSVSLPFFFLNFLVIL